MMLGTPIQNPISHFNIAETPRTEASSQKNMLMSTPKKHKSPKTQLMEDVTMSMDSAHLSTPMKNKGMRK
jgi:hypothetical protein